jgi:hypothetical protein
VDAVLERLSEVRYPPSPNTPHTFRPSQFCSCRCVR